MAIINIKPKPVYSTRVHRTSLQYKVIQNQFTVQGYTEPVYTLQYKGTQNQFIGMYRGQTLQ